MKRARRLACWALVLTALALASGCAFGYTRVPEPAGTDTRPTTEVHVWTHGQLLRLHGTTMLLDSITGIPIDDPFACDACRIGVPLSEVDSVLMEREGVKDLRTTGQAALVFAFLYFF